MRDTIYRQDAVMEIANHLGIPAENWMKIAEEWLRDVPSAEPERMRGKWEKGVGENGVTTSLFCSECNYENTRWYDWNYCPNCGADMRKQDG